MRIGILSRGPRLYSTRSIWRAGQRRGHQMYIYDHTRCNLLLKQGKPNVHFYDRPLHFLDAIIPRIGASVTATGAAVINQFELMDIFTPTGSDALLRARDKLRCLQELAVHKIPMPRTIMLGHFQNLHQQVYRLGGLPVVVKLMESTHGEGVVLSETYQSLLTTVEAFHRLGERIMLQEFIEEARGTDIRALVVDGKVVAAMKRSAQVGEFRSNLHRGASGEAIQLSKEDEALVIKVCDIMQLDVAGVDLLPSDKGSLVMEVNASPGLEGIENITGVNVASHIIDLVEKGVNSGRTKIND